MQVQRNAHHERSTALDGALRRDDHRIAVEQAAITLMQRGERVFGVLGLGPGDGASTFGLELAQILKAGGRNALVVDMTRAAALGEDSTAWSPEEASAAQLVDGDGAVPILVARPSAERRLMFQDAERLASMLEVSLANYAPVIVLLAQADAHGPNAINPFAVAAACDTVLLICDRGRTTRSRLRSALDLGEAAHVRFAGVVVDEEGHRSAANEIGSLIARLLWFVPPVARGLRAATARSSVLN